MARKNAESYILDVISKLDPSGFNNKLYKNMFKHMSDNDFVQFQTSLGNGEIILNLMESSETNKSIEDLLKIADSLDIPIFQYIDYTEDTGVFRPPYKYKVIDMIVRRASQDGDKGLHAPKGNSKRNPITGQTTGDSKGTTLTLPEIRILNDEGMEKSLVEYLGFRGGDLGARVAANAYIEKYGAVKLSDLEQYNEISGATKMVASYFKGAHISFKTEPVTK